MAMELGSCGKYFTVVVMTLINLLNYVDRYTIAGILPELDSTKTSGFKHDLTDTQNGLLQTAFIVSYMLFSPVFGYLGDRYIRKYIIAVGILAWSCCTLLGSFSVDYWMLLASRALVGIGEASYATIAPTIIADLFPAERRLRMLSVFYLAMPLGSAFGYILGSRVSQLVFSINHQPGDWKWALRITPLPAVILAVVVLTLVKEPVRGSTDLGPSSRHGVQGQSGLKAYLNDILYCLKNTSFVLSSLGYTAVTFTVGALAQFAPLFIIRASCIVTNQYPEATADLLFGGVTVLAGILGTLSGSELSKFLGKYTRKADAIVCALGVGLGTPCLYVALTVVQYRIMALSWVMVFLGEFFFCLNWAPVAAVLLYTVVPTRRATAEALQILMQHLLGDAFSPLVVGGLSDTIYRYYLGTYYTHRGSCNVGEGISLEFALFTTVFVCGLGMAAFLALTLTVEKDRKAVERFSRDQRWSGGVNEVNWEEHEGSDDESSRLLDDAVKEHLISTSVKQ